MKPTSGGVFSPIVKFASSAIGKKRFNSIRGKVISLHTQVINGFCTSIGADQKLRQGLIRVAKKNGATLGFLD